MKKVEEVMKYLGAGVIVYAVFTLCSPGSNNPNPDAVAQDAGTNDDTCGTCTVEGPIRVVTGASYKGTTSQEFSGAGGLGARNQACDAAYPGTRICTDADIMNSFPAPRPPAEAWVLWRTIATNGNIHYNSFGAYRDPGSLHWANCGEESPFENEAYGLGYTYTSNGNFSAVLCQGSYLVACCGP